MVVGVSRVTDLPSVNGTCAKVATDDDDDDDDGDYDVDDDDADDDDDDDDGIYLNTHMQKPRLL